MEEYSIDEAYAELSGLRRVHRGSYQKIALRIKQTVEAELGITVSLGLSLTKSLAKIASKHRKPSGFTCVKGYELHHIDQATLERLAEENGIEPLIGPAGSVAFVHCNVVHGSANNVSPWRRAILYLIYNAVSNACTGTKRPWYQNNRDFTPLCPLE